MVCPPMVWDAYCINRITEDEADECRPLEETLQQRQLTMEDAERMDDLQMAMKGSVGKETKAAWMKEKYWCLSHQMTEFLLEKWKQARAAVKMHFSALCAGLLGVPLGGIGVDEPRGSPAGEVGGINLFGKY